MKRAVAGASAGLLALTGIAAGAITSSASANETFSFTRLAGPDRYATAADIAVSSFNTADEVLLAAGGARNFPDSLAGNYLAGQRNVPVLLTANTSLPQATRDALTRLAATRVTILGGTSAVSAGVEAQLKSLGYTVTRLSGVDRYQTASEVAETPAATSVGTEGTKGRTAILASGQNFPDALAAGPVGFAEKFPVLITTPGSLSAPTRSTLQDLGIKNVLIAGGDVAVSQAAENEVKALGITTTRLSGPTRQLTAVAIANYARANFGFSSTHVDLARGDDFADALAGGPHSGRLQAPIILTQDANNLGTAARDYLVGSCGTLTAGHIFGGTAAVSEAVRTAGNTAARCTSTPNPTATATATASPTTSPTTPTNQTIAVAPTGAATLSPIVANDANGDGSTTDNRSFTASGLNNAETYRITLVVCENITTDSSGRSVFAFTGDAADVEADGNNLAATGNPNTDIISVNGIPTADAVDNPSTPADEGAEGGFNSRTQTATPVEGNITFTIDGDETECVTPVVYLNGASGETNAQGGSSPRLELDANGVPVEAFGLGGDTTFLPAEAVQGTYVNGNVIFLDEAQNFFVSDQDGQEGDETRFDYDSNDQFSYYDDDTGNTFFVTFAQFEDYLSEGDYVQTTDVTNYSPDAAVSNEFTLYDDDVDAPTGLSATVGDFDTEGTDDPTTTGLNEATLADDVRINFTAAGDGRIDRYTAEVYIDDADATTDCIDGTFADSADSDGNASSVTVTNLAEGKYCAVVYAVTESRSDSGVNPDYSAPVTFTINALPDDTTAPTLVDTRLNEVGGTTPATVDEGDVITLQLSEAFNPNVVNGAFRFTDPDGEIFQVNCFDPEEASDSDPTADNPETTPVNEASPGVNGQASCVLGSGDTNGSTTGGTVANSLLSVTLVDAPLKVGGPAGTSGAQVPGTITEVSATFSDTSSNLINLAGSADRVIDNEFAV